MDNNDRWQWATRGGLRFNQFSWPPSSLQDDLVRFGDDDWETVPAKDTYEGDWSEIKLVVPSKQGGTVAHERLSECPALLAVVDSLPGDLLNMCLARLGPGARVQEHRDISGGVSMGVARFHVPIVTHQDVEFYINGARVFMAEGELWSLDTTYPHRLSNGSDISRVHLIFDVKLNDELRAMFPVPTLRDRLHVVHFAGVCVKRGLTLALTDPAALATRVRKFVNLRFLGRSSLYDAE